MNVSVDITNKEELTQLVMSAIGTKFSSRWGPQMVDLAITAVLKVVQTRGEYKEVDIKRYVRYIHTHTHTNT
jgi:T-complex protein 1 subunit gamma